MFNGLVYIYIVAMAATYWDRTEYTQLLVEVTWTLFPAKEWFRYRITSIESSRMSDFKQFLLVNRFDFNFRRNFNEWQYEECDEAMI